MKYVEITWWPDAYHAYVGKERVGVVNCHRTTADGKPREIWHAHNKHFFEVGKGFPSRAKAAAVLNTKPIKHNSSAFK